MFANDSNVMEEENSLPPFNNYLPSGDGGIFNDTTEEWSHHDDSGYHRDMPLVGDG